MAACTTDVHLGSHEDRLWQAPWPQVDPAMLVRETFELVVQVNGRVRDRLQVPTNLSDEELVARATESPKVQAHLDKVHELQNAAPKK